MFIDTHCHLDYLKCNLDELFVLCEKNNVKKMISISVDPENVKKVVEHCSNFSNVYGTLGLHPHDSKLWSKELLDFFELHKNHPKIVAIGEIGLDYHYMHSSRDEQIKAFEFQLELAINWNLPVIIHTREAEDDTISILKNYLPKISSLVFHSYSSSLGLAEFAISNNCYMGFNGMVTFKKADNVREALLMTPLNQLVIETDAPFLAPAPYRGQENNSSYIPTIAQKIAEIKNVAPDVLENALLENTKKLFPKIAN